MESVHESRWWSPGHRLRWALVRGLALHGTVFRLGAQEEIFGGFVRRNRIRGSSGGPSRWDEPPHESVDNAR